MFQGEKSSHWMGWTKILESKSEEKTIFLCLWLKWALKCLLLLLYACNDRILGVRSANIKNMYYCLYNIIGILGWMLDRIDGVHNVYYKRHTWASLEYIINFMRTCSASIQNFFYWFYHLCNINPYNFKYFSLCTLLICSFLFSFVVMVRLV